MKAGQCSIDLAHAPPGFWRWPGDRPVRVDGITIDSCVPTRFFQTVDPYPPEWGRLRWRVQLNRLVAGRAATPVFRTFYPGVEWNLDHAASRWILTAWFKWDGPGPGPADSTRAVPPQVEGDTALFPFACTPRPRSLDAGDAAPPPHAGTSLFLRSRVDARDRRRISEALRSQPETRPKPDPALIVLDDIIEPLR